MDEQRKSGSQFVNGVNQAGKAHTDNGPTQVRRSKVKSNGFTDGMMNLLNAFANIFSPIKDNKKK